MEGGNAEAASVLKDKLTHLQMLIESQDVVLDTNETENVISLVDDLLNRIDSKRNPAHKELATSSKSTLSMDHETPSDKQIGNIRFVR